jgi:gliding motility-associated-like protein
MRKLIYLLALFAPTMAAQCDVSISNWDAITGDITIEAINSENCGCNEFTTEGNTCESSGSPYVSNNTTISHIVLGLHVEGLDYNWGCTGAVNHPGWTFKAFTLFGNQVLESGDTWSANVYDTSLASDCWAEILANDSLCTEIVVWQINLSRTASTAEGGWAVNGGGALQTQNYPDVDLSNNTAVYCAPVACDTVYVDVEVIEYITDTIWTNNDIYYYETIYENVYITDTLWLTEYINTTDTLWLTEYINTTDTLWLTEYITDTIIEYVDVEWITYDTIYVDVIIDNYVYVTDTVYVDVIIDNYVYLTDTLTLTEYILSIEYIDCDTGEACDEGPGMDGCDDDSIFIPNTFTPNNDGVNDIFYVVTDVTCWLTWNLQIYNRWGTLVEEMTDPTDYWTGTSRSGHWLCPDGVYTWKLNATEAGSATQLNGMVTIFR